VPADLQIRLTTEAACMVFSVSDDCPEDDRQALALLAQELREGRALETLDLAESSLAIDALLERFALIQKGESPDEGTLAGHMTAERLALAHATLCVHFGLLVDLQDELLMTLVASTALSLFELETVPVFTPELRAERIGLQALRDTVEGAMLSATVLELDHGQSHRLRQSLVASIKVLTDRPTLLPRVNMMDDLRARLTIEHLNAAYHTLIALERDTAVVA
jgi:hypothetical protein